MKLYELSEIIYRLPYGLKYDVLFDGDYIFRDFDWGTLWGTIGCNLWWNNNAVLVNTSISPVGL